MINLFVEWFESRTSVLALRYSINKVIWILLLLNWFHIIWYQSFPLICSIELLFFTSFTFIVFWFKSSYTVSCHLQFFIYRGNTTIWSIVVHCSSRLNNNHSPSIIRRTNTTIHYSIHQFDLDFMNPVRSKIVIKGEGAESGWIAISKQGWSSGRTNRSKNLNWSKQYF